MNNNKKEKVKIKFKNFKTFGNNFQSFSEKPITLVFGKNSIGKSSLIQMMAYRHYIMHDESCLDAYGLGIAYNDNYVPLSLRTDLNKKTTSNKQLAEFYKRSQKHRATLKKNRDFDALQVSGDAINLGGFRSFVHQKDSNNRIMLNYAAGRGRELKIEIGETTLQNEIDGSFKQIVDLKTSYYIDGDLIIEVIRKKSGKYQFKVTNDFIERFCMEYLRQDDAWVDIDLDEVINYKDEIYFDIGSTSNYFFQNRCLDEDRKEKLWFNIKNWTPEAEKRTLLLKEYIEKTGDDGSFNPYIPGETYKTDDETLNKNKRDEALPKLRLNREFIDAYSADKNPIVSLTLLIKEYAYTVALYINKYAHAGIVYRKYSDIDDVIRQKNQGIPYSYSPHHFHYVGSARRFDFKNENHSASFQAKMLQKLKDDGARKEFNKALHNIEIPHKLVEEKKYILHEQDFITASSISVEDIKKKAEKINELVFFDTRNNTVLKETELGSGAMVILPVLGSLIAFSGDTVAIEEPELHLHPSLQGKVADEIIKSAKKGNTLLVETHSEHIILRMLRRIRETTEGKLKDKNLALSPDDLCVLYIDYIDGKGTRITELDVTNDGDFRNKWPDGFFDERDEDLF